MSDTIWTPRCTVSAVIEREGRFLMVEELDDEQRSVFNQPAGHVENNESLIAAVEREVLEETGYRFLPNGFTGLYRWQTPDRALTFMRLNFIGSVATESCTDRLDDDIIARHWLSRAEIATRRQRSPLVLQCIDHYLAGTRYPLTALVDPETP